MQQKWHVTDASLIVQNKLPPAEECAEKAIGKFYKGFIDPKWNSSFPIFISHLYYLMFGFKQAGNKFFLSDNCIRATKITKQALQNVGQNSQKKKCNLQCLNFIPNVASRGEYENTEDRSRKTRLWSITCTKNHHLSFKNLTSLNNTQEIPEPTDRLEFLSPFYRKTNYDSFCSLGQGHEAKRFFQEKKKKCYRYTS